MARPVRWVRASSGVVGELLFLGLALLGAQFVFVADGLGLGLGRWASRSAVSMLVDSLRPTMLCSRVLMVTSALWRYFSAVRMMCAVVILAQNFADSLDAFVADGVKWAW